MNQIPPVPPYLSYPVAFDCIIALHLQIAYQQASAMIARSELEAEVAMLTRELCVHHGLGGPIA